MSTGISTLVFGTQDTTNQAEGLPGSADLGLMLGCHLCFKEKSDSKMPGGTPATSLGAPRSYVTQA